MVGDLYPRGPTDVPRELTKPTRAYKRRAWLALAGLLAFVALYVFLCFWFIKTAYRNITGALDGGDRAFVAFLVGSVAAVIALFLVKALFAVTRGGKLDNFELTAESEPELFRFLNRLADETRAPRPHRVFVSSQVNAAVFYHLSFLNLIFPSKKNLEIGLGLVNALTLSEFKAVLAHEFGHFAQRSMAVGRWVYVAQQIAGHIVARRDWFDRGLAFLSAIDLRIAWLGWLLRLIVWSIRSVLDTTFSLVVLAQRALSREMEFQADLVAVSVTGSDALIHALHRLSSADQAWDRTVEIAAAENRNGHRIADLFSIQTRVTEHMRVILGDPRHDSPPKLPEQNPGEHRIFTEQLAQVPRMWSTHPSNREREDNAKRRYIEAPLDDRAAWVLFSEPQKLRERISEQLLLGLPSEKSAQLGSPEQAVAAVDKRFKRLALDRRYRGAYLGRSPVLHAADAKELHGELSELETLQAALDGLYPEELSEQVAKLRHLEEEVACLEALRDGILAAPGGVIRHRGRTLNRKELPAVIAVVKQERARAREALCAHDRRCRTLHVTAANVVGHGWSEYLQGLARLLHYADHTEAEVDDAKGHLVNVFSVVIADGRVSQSERVRLVNAAHDFHNALWEVDQKRSKVVLPESVTTRLGIESWNAALPEFELDDPTHENIGDWLQVFESWHTAFSGALSALSGATLETLLEAEAHVSQSFREGNDPGPAPKPPKVPARYTTRVIGSERDRQRRLGLWDRFITADGPMPAFGRFVAAGAIVGSVLGFGGSVGDAAIIVYNGLNQRVTAQIGQARIDVPPLSTARLEVPPSDTLPISSYARNGALIESFEADVSNGLRNYVYNVASAAPLVEWTAVYGNRREKPPLQMGAPRFHAATADVLFAAPPTSVKTSGGGAQHSVLSGLGDATPSRMLAEAKSEQEANTMIAAHARWDAEDSPQILMWLALAEPLPSFRSILKHRLEANPREVAAQRAEQDAADPAQRRSLCGRHQELATTALNNADVQYLAIRCIEDERTRQTRFMEAAAAHPQNAWLAFAAGSNLLEHRDPRTALASLEIALRFPPLQERTALSIQRAVRLHPDVAHPSLKELTTKSPLLAQLVQLETGREIPDGPYRAYALLARGEYDAALDRAAQDPHVHARILRLAAASDGASRELIDSALALRVEEGLDANTVWASLALEAREQRSVAAYIEIAKRSADRYADTMLKIVEKRAEFSTPAEFDKFIENLSIELQAQAYVMGAILRGRAAPPEWRTRASALLFAPERPYFRSEPAGASTN